MIASFAAAIASAGAGLAAIWDHAGYNVGASLLALLSPFLALRAWNLTRQRRLEGIQRSQLDLRIVAVPNAEAVSFARQLRDAFVEAGWPATGVYRASPTHTGRTGLFLSVRDTNAPPPSAQYLLLALGEFGLQAVRSASGKLSNANALELLVGLRRTAE
jgi:hypothetical protein